MMTILVCLVVGSNIEPPIISDGPLCVIAASVMLELVRFGQVANASIVLKILAKCSTGQFV